MSVRRLKETLYGLYELAQGGDTAVGTGLTAPDRLRREGRRADRGHHPPALSSPRPTSSRPLAAYDAMVFSHGALSATAAALFKIANDIRYLQAPGPRAGLGELSLPGERAGLLDHAGQGQQPTQARGAHPWSAPT